MSKIKYFIQQSWLLIIASFCFGLLIALANAAWQPRIEQNKKDKLYSRMSTLLTNAEQFEKQPLVKIERGLGKTETVELYKGLSDTGTTIGWAFITEGSGFADKIELVVAVDAAFEKFAGYAILASNETPGFGDKIKNDYYRKQFMGAPAATLKLEKAGDASVIDSEIIAISGATVSSQAVVTTINNVIENVKSQVRQRKQ